MSSSPSNGQRPRIVVIKRRWHHRQGHPMPRRSDDRAWPTFTWWPPDSPQSGHGTCRDFQPNSAPSPLLNLVEASIEARSCSGTPVDCVKLAVAEVFGEDNLPDLLVSGVNHGSNASINVIYSGTNVGCRRGGHVWHSFHWFLSLLDERWDADFGASMQVARTMAAAVLDKGLPTGTCLNVNIPKVAPEDLKGIRVCRQAMGHWRDTFDQRETPRRQSLLLDARRVSEPRPGCRHRHLCPSKKATPAWFRSSTTSPPTTPLVN